MEAHKLKAQCHDNAHNGCSNVVAMDLEIDISVQLNVHVGIVGAFDPTSEQARYLGMDETKFVHDRPRLPLDALFQVNHRYSPRRKDCMQYWAARISSNDTFQFLLA
jgi:hypothetical protein